MKGLSRGNIGKLCVTTGAILFSSAVWQPTAMALPTVLAGPIRNDITSDQGWYYLLSASSWTDAEAKARQMGGHLVSPSTPQENYWLWNTMRHAAAPVVPDGLWIAYRQATPSGPCGSSDGTFTSVWVGFSAGFTFQWAAGQPDNGAALVPCEAENYVMMDTAYDGKWNDVVDSPAGISVHGVVEVSTFNAAGTINLNAYSGDVEPTLNGDMFNVHGESWANLNLFEGQKMGSIVADAQARDGWAYRINDTDATPAGTEKWVVRGGPLGDLTTILSAIGNPGTTAVARVKVPSWNDNGAGGSNLFIDDFRNDNLQTTHLRWDGQTPLLQETILGMNAAIPGGVNDGQYHIIRWTIGRAQAAGGGVEPNSLTINVYLDENPTPVLTLGPGLAGTDANCCNYSGYSSVVPYAGQVRDGWGFGTNAQNGTSDFYLDYFAVLVSKEGYSSTAGLSGQAPPGADHAFNDLIDGLENLNGTRCGLTISDPQFNHNISLAHCATNSKVFNLTNWSPSTTSYTIEEVLVNPDGSVTVGDVPWVTLSKTGGTISPLGGTDAVTVDLVADVPVGTNIAILRFNTDCSFAPVQVREIRLTVTSGGPPCTESCPDPFADVDEDNDVDGEDFAQFQLLYTGEGGVIDGFDEVARCLDRDNDNDIDAADYDAFKACRGRANVPANAACDDP